MTTSDFEVAIIGAGILGLSSARELLRRQPGVHLAVLEKEHTIASHQTGRNSGVIHSGIYYAPRSLKAMLCVEGAFRLKTFCRERGLPFDECGKLIIATEEAELTGLAELHRRGIANGVRSLELLDSDDIRRLEPHARGIRAIYSPTTAIVDYAQVASSLADDVRRSGGTILTDACVRTVQRRDRQWVLALPGGTIRATKLLSCAGLQSDRLARMTGGADDPRIVPFRGDYLALLPNRRPLVRGLIYPVPSPDLPFLGVHLTRRMNGEVWLGPNAVPAWAREGYRRFSVNVRDFAAILGWPGFWRVAARYWRTQAGELYRDYNVRSFVRQVQRYVPAITAGDCVRGPIGIRAQAVSRDGKLVDDFAFSQEEGVLHVRNAPSPAATACLAIAERIVDLFLS